MMTKDDYDILLNTMASRERPPEFAVKLLEDTCKRTGLDWKLRHVYLMSRGGKWMVTLSIDGFRLIGSQDSDYAGQEGPFWVTEATGTWSDVPPDGRIYAAKVGIKNKSGIVTWGVAKYADYAAGPMWTKFPSTMSAKCAEMLAWRKAFPGKLGGLYGVEEMAQASKAAADVVESGSASGSAPVSTESKAGYEARLTASANLEALKAVGREISTDKALSTEQVMELNLVYESVKKGLYARANI